MEEDNRGEIERQDAAERERQSRDADTGGETDEPERANMFASLIDDIEESGESMRQVLEVTALAAERAASTGDAMGRIVQGAASLSDVAAEVRHRAAGGSPSHIRTPLVSHRQNGPDDVDVEVEDDE